MEQDVFPIKFLSKAKPGTVEMAKGQLVETIFDDGPGVWRSFARLNMGKIKSIKYSKKTFPSDDQFELLFILPRAAYCKLLGKRHEKLQFIIQISKINTFSADFSNDQEDAIFEMSGSLKSVNTAKSMILSEIGEEDSSPRGSPSPPKKRPRMPSASSLRDED